MEKEPGDQIRRGRRLFDDMGEQEITMSYTSYTHVLGRGGQGTLSPLDTLQHSAL